MEFSADLFSLPIIWISSGAYLLILLFALVHAPWRHLVQSGLMNIFFGSCVVLLLLWSMRVAANEELTFHFLGVTAITLLFGWSLSVIISTIALVGVTFNTGGGWESFAINAFTTGIFPASLTLASLVIVRSLLPKNFFIYVLVNGFLTGGLGALISGYLAVAVLIVSGAFTLTDLEQGLMPFFPLMFMPEAFLNGWAMTILVIYRPHWVYSFSDRLYLDGK